MTKCLFIRTYYKDIEWLKLSLYTIDKYLTGIDEVILCYPSEQSSYFDNLKLNNLNLKKVTCSSYKNDYLGQQISKLNAYQYTNCDIIMYFDSDCVFTDYINVNYYLEDDKLVIYKDNWSILPEYAQKWKGITEKALGYDVNYEYMRCFPFLYYRESLINLNNYFKNRNIALDQYILSQEIFSEFNLIGAYLEKYESDKYLFKIGIEKSTSNYIKQFWSHDKITEEIIKEIIK